LIAKRVHTTAKDKSGNI